jgi:hypothetical protein
MIAFQNILNLPHNSVCSVSRKDSYTRPEVRTSYFGFQTESRHNKRLEKVENHTRIRFYKSFPQPTSRFM